MHESTVNNGIKMVGFNSSRLIVKHTEVEPFIRRERPNWDRIPSFRSPLFGLELADPYVYSYEWLDTELEVRNEPSRKAFQLTWEEKHSNR